MYQPQSVTYMYNVESNPDYYKPILSYMYMWPLTAQQQSRSHGDDGALRTAQVRQLAKVVHGVLEEERHLNIGQL